MFILTVFSVNISFAQDTNNVIGPDLGIFKVYHFETPEQDNLANRPSDKKINFAYKKNYDINLLTFESHLGSIFNLTLNENSFYKLQTRIYCGLNPTIVSNSSIQKLSLETTQNLNRSYELFYETSLTNRYVIATATTEAKLNIGLRVFLN